MLAFGQIALKDGDKFRPVEESIGERIEQRSEPADGGSPQQASGPKNAMGFAQRGEAIVAPGEVIRGPSIRTASAVCWACCSWRASPTTAEARGC